MTLCGPEAGPLRRGLDRAAFVTIVLAPVVVALGIALGAVEPPWRTDSHAGTRVDRACAIERAPDTVGR